MYNFTVLKLHNNNMTNKNPKRKFTCRISGDVRLYEEYFGNEEIKIIDNIRVYIDGELMKPQFIPGVQAMDQIGCEGDYIGVYDTLYKENIMGWWWKDKTFRLYDGKLYFRYIDDKFSLNLL